jgi:hypothetical protein
VDRSRRGFPAVNVKHHAARAWHDLIAESVPAAVNVKHHAARAWHDLIAESVPAAVNVKHHAARAWHGKSHALTF